jgi:mRNA-degrading endonuclease RelE of RelBE toxin-antitoxin system
MFPTSNTFFKSMQRETNIYTNNLVEMGEKTHHVQHKKSKTSGSLRKIKTKSREFRVQFQVDQIEAQKFYYFD